MIEDFTYSEIEDIIKENYFDVKETLEQLVLAQKADTRSTYLSNRIKESQAALRVLDNLMEDLGVEVDDGIIMEADDNE